MIHDDSIKFQAFSHLSRAHLSISTSFYSVSFAFFAYVGFFIVNIYPRINNWFLFSSLTLFPAIIWSYLLLKYFVINIAVNKCAKDIKLSDGRDLYLYLWGYPNGLHAGFPLGNLFLRLNQPLFQGGKNPVYCIIWFVIFPVLVLLFFGAFYCAMKYMPSIKGG